MKTFRYYKTEKRGSNLSILAQVHGNLRSGVPYIFCRGGKVRLIQLLEYLSAAP